MNQDEINQKFKKVSDEVESMAGKLEQDVKIKNSAIRDETAKKFSGTIISS
jgi:hypothetical protein